MVPNRRSAPHREPREKSAGAGRVGISLELLSGVVHLVVETEIALVTRGSIGARITGGLLKPHLRGCAKRHQGLFLLDENEKCLDGHTARGGNLMHNLSRRFIFRTLVGLAENRCVTRERGLLVVLHAYSTLSAIRISQFKESVNFLDTHGAGAKKLRVADDVAGIKSRPQRQHESSPGFAVTAAGTLKVRGCEKRTPVPNN